MNEDSQLYKDKKKFYGAFITIFGRKPVLEALQDSSLSIHKIHLADSNKPASIIKEILALCRQRNIEVAFHDKKSLSRISRNSKQDQGIAADIASDHYQSLDEFLASKNEFSLIALDNITNPQNLGMIIRSCCAGFIDGLIIPKQGCAGISPLVIKASVGTLFKTKIIYCDQLCDALPVLKKRGAVIYKLTGDAKQSVFDSTLSQSSVYVLGNETEGVSAKIEALCDSTLTIPMNNGVESLNVAVAAALIAFSPYLRDKA